MPSMHQLLISKSPSSAMDPWWRVTTHLPISYHCAHSHLMTTRTESGRINAITAYRASPSLHDPNTSIHMLCDLMAPAPRDPLSAPFRGLRKSQFPSSSLPPLRAACALRPPSSLPPSARARARPSPLGALNEGSHIQPAR